MFTKILTILMELFLPKNIQTGTMVWGARHTTIAAMIMGSSMIYSLNQMQEMFETRKEAQLSEKRMTYLEQDAVRTKIFVTQYIQQANDRHEQIKEFFGEINTRLKHIESIQKKDSVSLEVVHNLPINKK